MSGRVMYRALGIVSMLALVAGCARPIANGTTGGAPLAAGTAPANPPGAAAPATTPEASNFAGRGITVVGTGRATGTPDVANVTIGVDSEAASVESAVSDNRTRMSALLDALKAAGIADKDLQTTNYSLFTQRPPLPNSTTGGTAAVTYHVSNQVIVKVRDVSKLGDVLDRATAAGANNIYGVTFGVDDPSKLQSDARAKAVADARARAASLAQLAGVTLGDVVSINETAGFAGPIVAQAAGMGGGGAPVEPGQMDVSVTVQVTFAIK